MYALTNLYDGFIRAQNLLTEKWRNFCPEIVYLPQSSECKDADDLWGDDFSTEFSPDDVEPVLEDLWGDDIESEAPCDSMGDEEEHFWIHALALRDPTFEQLGKLQVWNEKDLIVVVPKEIFEEQDIVAQIGDEIVIGRERYNISEILRWGRWQDSDEFLLAILNCEAKKQ